MPSNYEKLRRLSGGLDALEREVIAKAAVLDTIMAHIPAAIVIADRERFHYASQAFADLVGRTREELTTQPWRAFLHPDDLPQDEEHRLRMENEVNSEGGFTNRYLRSDGECVRVRWMMSEHTDDSGLMYCIVEKASDA